jgi:hypothetical protein
MNILALLLISLISLNSPTHSVPEAQGVQPDIDCNDDDEDGKCDDQR